MKIWADGGMSSRTAAIHGTYPVPPHGSGILFFTRDELTSMVREFDTRGFQVAVHAQGDRAIETVLDAYATVLAARAWPARAWPARAFPAPPARQVRDGTRGGTGSSTPGRCTRSSRPGPRSSAS